jgi:hypothetical protein
MEIRRSSCARPSPLVAGVFRVCDVCKRFRLRGATYFVLILASYAERHTTIAGPQAARLNRGELVRVRGCVLCRGGRPVLVASSLDPVIYGGRKPPQLHCDVDSSKGRLSR